MRATERRAFSVLAAALLQSFTATAAEPSFADQAFEQGRQEMASGNYERACSLFESSYRAEAATGALLNLAVCEEKLRRLNAAVAHLEQSLNEIAPSDERRSSIVARLEVLRARIPHLVLRSQKPLDPGVSVTLDEKPIERERLGAALAIDPGHHAIRCTDQRGPVCAHEFEIDERQTVEWSIAIGAAPRTAQAVSRPRPPAPRQPAVKPAPKSRTPLILATGAVGLAGLAVGLFAGAEVLHWKNTMDHHCDGGCDAEGMRAAARGRTWSWVSNIGIGVGVLGLGSSAYLAITARSSQGRDAELAVRGSF